MSGGATLHYGNLGCVMSLLETSIDFTKLQ